MDKKEHFLKEIRENLFSMQDLSYRDFHARLMPTIDKETIIGVRTPALRSYAKGFIKAYKDDEQAGQVDCFLQDLPHGYYEENNLHGFIIETINDYEKCLKAINTFLPYVDNWATCDMMAPKVFKKHLPQLESEIVRWLSSEETYTIRFGVNMLMKYYLDEAFDRKYLDWAADIRHDDYYVKMVVAWYFATALAKQYEDALPYVKEGRMEKWTHNKTIQKAVESYRITEEQKIYLKTLKVK